MFLMLFAVTKQAWRLADDDKVMDILKHRLAKLQPSSQSVDEFLAIDEAHEVLDVEDIEEVSKAKDKIKRSQAAFDKFGQDFSAKRRETMAASASSSSKTKTKELVLPEVGRIPHSEAKKFMPPGGQLWQDTNPGAWHSRRPGLGGSARRWSTHGQEEALHLVVREAWKQHCYLEGIPPQLCPCTGAF